MSWQPSNDPRVDDRRDCPALDLVVVPKTRDLGDLLVRRTLPQARRQMVGPFIFYDHFGPVEMEPGKGMDVRPHPHIGLATVTYLLEGSIAHRDSEGNVQDIMPGAMNLMTAGRGIAHSERTPRALRQTGHRLHGLQSWIALPVAHEETAPSFQHFPAESLPTVDGRGLKARVIAGSAFGKTAPVEMFSDWFYVDVSLEPGITVPLDADHEERAIYIVEGAIEIGGERFSAGTDGGPQLLIFRPGDVIGVTALAPSRVMFLGGAHMDGHRHIWWNFVSSSQERIEQAKADWKAGRFKPVPGETEFIPLPE